MPESRHIEVTISARSPGRSAAADGAGPREPLIQLRYRRQPWRMLTTCVLLNRTSGIRQVKPMLGELFATFPQPQNMEDDDRRGHGRRSLEEIIGPLGLQNRRAESLRRLAACYPGRRMSREEVLALPGCGPYAADAYEILVLGDLTVAPDDVELQRWLSWARRNPPTWARRLPVMRSRRRRPDEFVDALVATTAPQFVRVDVDAPEARGRLWTYSVGREHADLDLGDTVSVSWGPYHAVDGRVVEWGRRSDVPDGTLPIAAWRRTNVAARAENGGQDAPRTPPFPTDRENRASAATAMDSLISEQLRRPREFHLEREFILGPEPRGNDSLYVRTAACEAIDEAGAERMTNVQFADAVVESMPRPGSLTVDAPRDDADLYDVWEVSATWRLLGYTEIIYAAQRVPRELLSRARRPSDVAREVAMALHREYESQLRIIRRERDRASYAEPPHRADAPAVDW